jgi:hypothetical protein
MYNATAWFKLKIIECQVRKKCIISKLKNPKYKPNCKDMKTKREREKERERDKGRVTMQKYYTPSKLPFFAMAILTILQDYLPFYLLSANIQNLPLPLSKKPETPQEHPKKYYNCPN